MAGKSKSSENKENSKDNADIDVSEDGKETEASDAESIADDPVIIEGEATEVDAKAEDFPLDAEAEETADPDTATDAEAAEADEIETPDEPDTTPASTAPVEQPAGGGASVLALVFGGIIAGGLGYFASTLAPKPEAPVFDDTALSAGIAANTAALEDLESGIGALKNAQAPEVDLSSIETELGAITQTLGQLEGALSEMQTSLSETAATFDARATELDERIIALETAVPAAGELATEDELRALRTRIEEMMASAETRLAEAQAEAEQITLKAAEMRAASEAEAMEAAAAAEAREAELIATAERQAALIDLKSAIEGGASYASILPALGPVPDALSANADDGVATFKALRDSFPDAARAALAASVTVGDDASTGERLTAFLKRRTNARSLTEQEGDAPDAVLSRAEARLGEGDLTAAVSELQTLPETGKSALADWLEQAETRLSAVAAIDELTATN